MAIEPCGHEVVYCQCVFEHQRAYLTKQDALSEAYALIRTKLAHGMLDDADVPEINDLHLLEVRP